MSLGSHNPVLMAPQGREYGDQCPFPKAQNVPLVDEHLKQPDHPTHQEITLKSCHFKYFSLMLWTALEDGLKLEQAVGGKL